jgi:hypothetical protein
MARRDGRLVKPDLRGNVIGLTFWRGACHAGDIQP